MPVFAAAVMLPILLAIDIIGVVVFRGRSDTANLRIILPGAMLGIGVGWWWADAVLTAANGPAWVGSAAVRVRDQGHLLHAEVFVVPSAPVELADLEALVDTIQGLDWKLNDVVVVPVSRLPDAVRATPAAG